MKVKVITAFNDMSIADANARRREIDDEFEVDALRAADLHDFGFVEPQHPDAPDVTAALALAAPAPAADPLVADPLHLTADMAGPAAAPVA